MPRKSNKANKQHFWQKHIRAFKKSGVTRVAYCREHDVDYDQFGYYLKKLQPERNQSTDCTVKAIGEFIPVEVRATAPAGIEFTLTQADGARLQWSAHWGPKQLIEFLDHWRAEP